MTGLGNCLVEAAARLLPAADLEAVLGDLAEADASCSTAIAGILGFAARRQVQLWRSWRPWVAAFALCLPASWMLMGISVATSETFLTLHNHATMSPAPIALLLAHLFATSWAVGFAAVALSRRTIWVSVLIVLLSFWHCVSLFHIPSLTPFCLLLFLPTTLFGLCAALRRMRLPLWTALLLAVPGCLLTLQQLPNTGFALSLYDFALLWPCWYLCGPHFHATALPRNLDHTHKDPLSL